MHQHHKARLVSAPLFFDFCVKNSHLMASVLGKSSEWCILRRAEPLSLSCDIVERKYVLILRSALKLRSANMGIMVLNQQNKRTNGSMMNEMLGQPLIEKLFHHWVNLEVLPGKDMHWWHNASSCTNGTQSYLLLAVPSHLIDIFHSNQCKHPSRLGIE